MGTSRFRRTGRSGALLTPTASGFHRVDRHRLYWELHGRSKGSTVVFLHHGLGSTRSWRRQVPAFVAKGWQVLVYDRWGYGRSDARAAFEKDFLYRDAEESLSLITGLGFKRVSIVGHSDGGSIGILLASQHSELVERLVLVAAHIYAEPKMEESLELLATTSRQSGVSAALVKEHGARAQALVQAWLEGWLQPANRDFTLVWHLPRIQCPTFVVQGELDEHATPQHARDLAAWVPNGELWLIGDVKHMPNHEIPEAFNQRVLEFLEPSLVVTSVI